MRREFVCPRCGLVLEANAVEGVVWMGEHVAACVVPTRARFTALVEPPLAFTWAETLSVADAEFLQGLGIDPL